MVKLLVKMSRCFFALLFSFVLTCKVLSQDYQMQISPVEDRNGDKPSATFAIVEDKEGFIWFGTVDGLYRFDGFNYKIFRNNPNNINSLSNNTIRGMALDNKGIIWIATQGGGLDAFDPSNEKFINYRHFGQKDNELSGNSLWSVLIDHNNDVWVGVAGKGIDKIEQKTGKIKHYSVLENGGDIFQDQIIRSLLEDRDGFIWAGVTDLGLSCIDPGTGKTKNYKTKINNENSLSNNSAYELYLGSDQKIWIATFGGGINIFEKENEKFTHLISGNDHSSIISDLTYSVAERLPGEYWIATEYGLSIFFQKSGNVKNFQQNDNKRITISENRIRKIFIDSKGIVWAGTESGVEKFVTQSNFRTYTDFFNQKSGNNSAIVKAIYSDDDYFWIGFIDYGLLRYSYKTHSSKHYFGNSVTSQNRNVSNVNAILSDKNKNLWIGDWNYGLLKYNNKTDKFDNISNGYFEKNRLSDNRIQRIIEDKRGILWIGTEGGLNRYNISTDEFICYKHNPNNSNSLSSNSIQSQAMVFDKDSNLWIGTWSYGLNKIEFTDSNRVNANFMRWMYDPTNPNSLPNNNVISLLYDTTALWIGTFGGGLSRFDLETNYFTTYTTNDGLPNNTIFAICKDKNGNLWLSTDYGISMFDPNEKTFSNYTQEDGLQDNHFFWGAAFMNSKGTIFFGGIKGVNSFFPENVKPNRVKAKPVIVDVRLFNNSLGVDRYNSSSNEIHFYYYENFISFEFAALDYSEPNSNQYRYKLDGFDEEWIYSNNLNQASYTNLPPDNYTFLLQVSNSDGIWNDEILSLNVIIIPPWWKTSIAKILLTILFFSLIISIHLLRINILNKQKKHLEQQVKERTIEINKKNDELKEKYEEVVTQEEEIREQTEELRALSEKLKSNNKLLSQKVKERTIELEDALYKAEDAQKLISSFLSNLSHEIRTPLNAIMGFSQLVTSHNLNQTLRDQYSGIIEQNVNSLLAQIENIMDIAKLHTGQYRLKNSEFLLNDILTETYNEFYNSKEYANKKLRIEFKTNTNLKLYSDKAVFKNIIYNLVENAFKYTEHGVVEIGFRINPPENKNLKTYLIGKKTSLKLEVFVNDTGIGIPKDKQKIVFDAFRKVEQNNQKLYRGSGIGLALVKNLTEKLNGKIILQSEVNKGTSVKIEFQLAEI